MRYKKKIYLLLIINLLVINNGFSQVGWKIIWKSWEPSDTLFDINKMGEKKYGGYLFPEFFHNDTVRHFAPLVLKNKESFEKKFKKSILVNFDSTFLRTRLYTENIDSLYIKLYTT